MSLIVGLTLLWVAPPPHADETSRAAEAEERLEPIVKGLLAQMDSEMPVEQRSEIGEMQGKAMTLITATFSKTKPALARV